MDSRVKEWKAYIASLGQPADDEERTRFHYLCQEYGKDFKKKLVLNAVACGMTLPVLVLFAINRLFVKKENEPVDALLFSSSHTLTGALEDVPPELKSEYPRQVVLKHSPSAVGRFKSSCIDARAFKMWLRMALRYPFAFYMNFYLLLHFGITSRMLLQYDPRAIISIQTEQDFSTSLMSCYCEAAGVEYIGFMHGEYMLSIDRSFVRFSRYFAWDWASVKLFTVTGSPADMFHVYQSSRLLPKYHRRENPEYFLTYYLSGENRVQMEELKDRIAIFTDAGKKCSIRMHPRWTDRAALHELFDEMPVVLENVEETSLKDSVENAEYIVAVCSTVLTEAHVSGLKAVIDDMSSYLTISELEEKMYANLYRIDARLSGLIKELEKQGK